MTMTQLSHVLPSELWRFAALYELLSCLICLLPSGVVVCFPFLFFTFISGACLVSIPFSSLPPRVLKGPDDRNL